MKKKTESFCTETLHGYLAVKQHPSAVTQSIAVDDARSTNDDTQLVIGHAGLRILLNIRYIFK